MQGLIRCGRCGRRMQVGYSGKTLVPNYSCVRGNQLYGTERCQSVGGRRIERVVLDAVFEALQPAGIEATLRAIEHASSDHARARALRRAGARARADPRRARPPPVRRLRAREPARRAHAGARMGAAPHRGPPRRARRGRGRRPAPRPAHRRGDRLVPACRRRSAQGVRRAHHHRPRAQAAAARDPHRGRRHRRPRSRAAHRTAAGRVGGRRGHRAHRAACHAPAATRAAPTRTRSRSCASSPSTTPTSRSPRSSPARDGAPAPATRSPPTASPGCAPTTRSPPAPVRPTSARWRGGHDRESRQRARRLHRDRAPLAARRVHHRRADHPRRALADPAHRRAPRSASASTPPTAGCRSPKPRRRSASPARPCCTRSNAASSPPSTSTAASEKAYESRSNPTKLDCSTTTSDRRRSAKPTPRA